MIIPVRTREEGSPAWAAPFPVCPVPAAAGQIGWTSSAFGPLVPSPDRDPLGQLDLLPGVAGRGGSAARRDRRPGRRVRIARHLSFHDPLRWLPPVASGAAR